MVTRDISRAVTIEQLKRQYNLDNKQMKQAIEQSKTNLIKVENELNGYIDSTTKELKKIQDQVDGNITTWFFSGVPTLENNPAVEWTEEKEKNNHLGDLYYDKDTGYAYRFTLEDTIYSWMKLTDSDISEALALANTAKDTADSKRRVFVEQPTPPYDSGDFWLKNKELYICQVSKETGPFEENDFIIATKYTDDTYAKKVEQNLTIVSGKVTTIEQGIDEINTTMEENKYYVDADGNKQLISSDLSAVKQTTKDYEIIVGSIETKVNNTVKTVSKQYKIKDSTDNWSDTYPIRQEGQVILAREKYIHTDDSITYSTEYEITGDKGDKGDQGIQGIQGPVGADGTSTYFYVRYSANANGNPMTTTPNENTQYMGVTSTTSNIAPTSYTDYTWSRTKGNTGEKGTAGETGADGKTTYLHIKYSEDGITFTPANAEYELGEKPSAYIGQYTDFNAIDSVNFSDYTWYKFTEDIDETLGEIQDSIGGLDIKTNNNYQELKENFENYTPKSQVAEIERSVKKIQTDTYTKTEINTKLIDGSVKKVSTTSGTFDEDGMHYKKSNAPTSSTINHLGVDVKSTENNQTLLFAGYDEELNESIVKTENLTVNKYFVCGNSRIENYGTGGGMFVL